MFDPLPDDLAAAVTTGASRLGAFAAVHYRADVDSTNDLALVLASTGAPEGTSVVADSQRRGRGRRGHVWFSPPGAGLYVSVIVRPDMAHGAPPLLTLAAGVAMAEAVTAVSGLPVALKWPNDLVIGWPWRKLGGVLAEAVSAGSKSDAVVIGMGINVRGAVLPPDLRGRASAIETELGRNVDRAALAVELLVHLRLLMDQLRTGRRTSVTARWRSLAAVGLGRPVRWTDSAGPHRGIARDIDEDGALMVAGEAGVTRVMAGEVTWEDGRGE